MAGLTACKVNPPAAGPDRAGPARLTCGQKAPPALTHFPFRPRRKQSPPPPCIGPAAEGGLYGSFARGRVSRDRTAVKRLAQTVNPEPKFLLALARAVKKKKKLSHDHWTNIRKCVRARGVIISCQDRDLLG